MIAKEFLENLEHEFSLFLREKEVILTENEKHELFSFIKKTINIVKKDIRYDAIEIVQNETFDPFIGDYPSNVDVDGIINKIQNL